MQENEFEKRVQKQMEEFVLVPNKDVWKQVEAKIGKEKRRRFFFYWIMTGLLITGGTGIFLFINSRSNSRPSDISSNKRPDNNSQLKSLVIEKRDETFIDKNKLIKKDTKVKPQILQSYVFNKHTPILNSQKNYLSEATPKQDIQLVQEKQEVSLPLTKENIIAPTNTFTSTRVNHQTQSSKVEIRTELLPHKYFLSQADQKLKQDLIQKPTTSIQPQSSITDTSLLNTQHNVPNSKDLKNRLKKWQIGFQLNVGVSDNVEGINLVSAKSVAAFDQSNLASLQSSSLANSPRSISSLQYKSGASFGAGIYLKKGLTRKLNATVGLNYQFMSAKSRVGNKIDSTLRIYDSVLQKPTTVNSFYYGGQVTSFSNKYHFIQLPVNIQFQLNKNTNHPFFFSVGLSPSFLFASDALYLNNKAKAYYQEKKQFNYFLLFGQSELLYILSNKSKYQLSIGPALQYNFNSLNKTTMPNRQHLLFSGIKTNITFK